MRPGIRGHWTSQGTVAPAVNLVWTWDELHRMNDELWAQPQHPLWIPFPRMVLGFVRAGFWVGQEGLYEAHPTEAEPDEESNLCQGCGAWVNPDHGKCLCCSR